MKTKFLATILIAFSSPAFAKIVPQMIRAHRNCDMVIESTDVDPVASQKIFSILAKRGFRLVPGGAEGQNAEFLYKADLEHNGPIVVSASVSVLRKLGEIEYVYVNAEDIGFPHLPHRGIRKIINMTELIPYCQIRN